jgi:hypothetical protein
MTTTHRTPAEQAAHEGEAAAAKRSFDDRPDDQPTTAGARTEYWPIVRCPEQMAALDAERRNAR